MFNILADFIICAPSIEEAQKLEIECNIEGNGIIKMISDEFATASLFQKRSDESETSLEELNKHGSLARIVIAEDNDQVVSRGLSEGWDPEVWSGFVIRNIGEAVEYRKVYPFYTS